MLSVNYNQVQFSNVIDYNDFYKTKLPEIIKIRSLVDNTKLLFNLPGDRVILQVGQGERIYKLLLLSPDIKKNIIGWIIYLPLESRLDIFLPDNPDIPLLQWKNKQAVHKNYATLLDRAGLDKLFSRLVNII